MPAPYSSDLRARVIAAHRTGLGSREHLAALFKIGTATVYRWVHAERTTGRVSALPATSGKKPKIHPDEYDRLKRLVMVNSDRTLLELAKLWEAETGMLVDKSTLGRTLHRAGISLKKRPSVRRSATVRSTRKSVGSTKRLSTTSTTGGSSISTKPESTSP